ncbi:tyrosine--tRNA ligase [Buchnera aphidicola]|uniref:Tyrosine--tRNA ligase n=1 Tax=Buchnera aphidicola subsp. Tuberolachnus salignus TaxID=98804 RepID=A0A160SWD2_BUCTT|nr:tyrosine--tRNA ligase [Buchnera aphidicola]CUR53062.1 Tyrosine--tRNA ligase [Buchnera aphidicola (Tuberolachnus salignus)]
MKYEHDCLNLLKKRGLIFQISNELSLQNYIFQKKIFLYCGFDPTADSLHLGHLLPIICLKIFQKYGHTPYILIGGGTCLIGDPSFKKGIRKKIDLERIKYNQKKIKNQLSFFFPKKNDVNDIHFLNNNSWLQNMNFFYFLENIGKYFSVNSMMNRESVKKRLEDKNFGLSFTEFTYSLLQAYDFYHLYKTYGIILQIGGSDQWGNMISGIHLINKIYQKQVFSLTTPLFTKFNGEKFGKTETGTIWLDSKKTSPYSFYQFWRNLPDNTVDRAFQLFLVFGITISIFVPINNLKFKDIIEKKIFLAENMTLFVHGQGNLLAVQRIVQCLFHRGDLSVLTEIDFLQLLQDGIPSYSNLEFCKLPELLVKIKLAPSRYQARVMILSGAIQVNRKIQKDINFLCSDHDIFFKKFTLICRGKKHYVLIHWKK